MELCVKTSSTNKKSSQHVKETRASTKARGGECAGVVAKHHRYTLPREDRTPPRESHPAAPGNSSAPASPGRGCSQPRESRGARPGSKPTPRALLQGRQAGGTGPCCREPALGTRGTLCLVLGGRRAQLQPSHPAPHHALGDPALLPHCPAWGSPSSPTPQRPQGPVPPDAAPIASPHQSPPPPDPSH